MQPLFLVGGALLLLTASKSASAALSDPNNPAAFKPGAFLGTQSKPLVGAALEGMSNPAVDMSQATSFANYAFVENALEAMGYNIDEISDAAINACVYRVSVYFWYYQFQAIGKIDPSKVLTETGAYAVIDEWIKVQGYSAIAGIPWNKSTERNKLVSYNPNLKQGMYLAGVDLGDAAEIVSFVSENQDMIEGLTSFLESIGFDAVGATDGAIVLQWLVENGVSDPIGINIQTLIDDGSKYWDAAVVFHIYLVGNPSVMSTYTPVYLK